jgi:DNA-binding transcriptional regulator YdaS (Cro superfamily)
VPAVPTTSEAPIEAAVRAVGSQALLARALGVTRQQVNQWVHSQRPVPARYVLDLEAASGVSRHRLRPDIFGPRKRA